MTAEIVDYLLIFWVVLAIFVYAVGSIYDKQLQDKRKKRHTKPAHTSTNLDELAWSSGASGGGGSYDSPEIRSRHHNAQYQAGGSPSATSAWSGRDNDNNSNYYQRQPNYHDEPARYGSSSYETGPSFNDHHYHQQQVGNRRSSYQPAGDFYYGTGMRASPGSGPISNATIPTASGFNADCVEWVNSIMYLFYSQPEKYGPIIGENVYRSLNEKLYNLTSSSSEHSQLLVEFTSLNLNECTRPELTNMRTESESDKSISVTCKIYNRRLSFALAVRRLTTSSGDESLRCHELVLENLEGKLKSMTMLNEKLIVIQFIERPDMKISLKPVAHMNNSYGGNESAGQLMSEDSLVQLILQSITQVVVDLYFGDDIDFPQYKRASSHGYSAYKNKLNNMFKGSASELKRQLKHDLFGALTSNSEQQKEREVFVKIIKATNINYNQNVTCLMELESPKQQALTSTKRGSDPFWDEHFLFVVNERSNELTLELWDSIDAVALNEYRTATDTTSGSSSLKRNQKLKQQAAKWHKSSLVAGAKFLGLARVSIEELRRNPVQKVNLMLQSMSGLDAKDLSNSVGGELQLELLFMEHSSSSGQQPPASSPTSMMHKSNSLSSLAYQQGDVVSIDRKLTPSGFVITTTTITKQPASSQQQNQPPAKSESLLTTRNQSPLGSSSMATEHSFDELNFDGLSTSQLSTAAAAAAAARVATSATATSTPDARSETMGAGSSTGGRLSRSRSRSRSFIRAIRKRFSFSRTRSRSVGESGAPDHDGQQSPIDYEAHSRASSELSAVDRADAGQQGGRAKSVPTSRDPSEVPTIVINKGRLSEDSAFTFGQPKSLLVYEVLEPGLSDGIGDGSRRASANDRYRYYAVTNDNQANQRKWRKRGLKLHLFNEHQFVACHLAGSSTCHLCGRMFSRRPGKQGYKCRNCHLLSHKQCHVKVDHNCPYAQRNGLKLEYIDADPPAALLDEVNQSGSIGNMSPVSSSLEMTHQHYQQRPMASSSQYYSRQSSSSQRGKQKPATLRMGTKSISVDVDDR